MTRRKTNAILKSEVIDMRRMISSCPCCHETLRISTLQCPGCGTEIKNDFELSRFDLLDDNQYDFLLSFLKCRGSLKDVQTERDISYPTAKKQLDELLQALNLKKKKEKLPVKVDICHLTVDRSSKKASEIIKAKLIDNGGRATVYTARGLPCEIYAASDGKSFISDKLPIKPPYEFVVFDVIVDLLRRQDGTARKGNGRNYKLGESGCEENTVVGTVAKYRGNQIGESVFDPVFVLAAILEWAGIAENGRGELILL